MRRLWKNNNEKIVHKSIDAKCVKAKDKRNIENYDKFSTNTARKDLVEAMANAATIGLCCAECLKACFKFCTC